ncbi:MAG: beta-ketoacyl-[acyl-carrier-protein] synthase family protein [Planctomycetes bacterium]|nr:beta-ketoacyl-[acyl-carrier-protein] synthase family protein [Planctomycetota bacterium]MCW8134271.1 beta-ketoacyl-[acyl-carrier-protein] synthase family protein [Planctomycetota bacterium]
MSERVFITGLAAVSCLGNTLAEIDASLRAGRSGIVLDQRRRELGFRSSLTGAVPAFDPKARLDRKARKTMHESTQWQAFAALEAIEQAGLKPVHLRTPRTGLIIGNDSTSAPNVEIADAVRRDGTTQQLGSGYIFQAMNSSPTMNLNTLLGTQGAAWTLAAACASGAHAVGQGFMLIRAGMQDVVITGGMQEITWESMASFDALGTFSKREEEPQQASRPFDRARDGLVPSGGAAAVILESESHLKARSGVPLVEVRGYAFSSDGEHLTLPSGEGAMRAMRGALHNSSLDPSSIDYINAHATSTPIGDAKEAGAIREVFGERTPVSSTKSMTGHECWMSGASEVLYTALMLRGGFIAPNINFEAQEDEAPKINVAARTIERPLRNALVNSFGFGGTNASIVLSSVF